MVFEGGVGVVGELFKEAGDVFRGDVSSKPVGDGLGEAVDGGIVGGEARGMSPFDSGGVGWSAGDVNHWVLLR